MIPLLGGANNAAPQGALDALSAFGQNGPRMPDFSGAQFGGSNNLASAGATNPFSMSGAAGAAASKLPNMGGAGGAASGGGMAGLSGSINKLIASNNKLVAALNKVAASMGKGGGGGSAGASLMGAGGRGGDPMGVFEQLNLQKDTGIRGGGGSGGDDGADTGKGPGASGKEGGFQIGVLGVGAGLLGAGAVADYFGSPVGSPMKKLGGQMMRSGSGFANLGAGTSLQAIASSLPFGLGTKTAQNLSVLEGRAGPAGQMEMQAFRTASAIGRNFTGTDAALNMMNSVSGALSDAFGYSPEMAMENVLDVYTTGGFRTGKIGGTGRDIQEKSMSVSDIFRFKQVGFGSTVLGGIQEMFARGSGARELLGTNPADIARFGAGNMLGARGMNKLTEGLKSFGSQANMFGMGGGVRGSLMQEILGFENKELAPVSFQGFQNAMNRGFMTHQRMMAGTTQGIESMFSGLAGNMGMAMDVRAARESLGSGASGVEIMREARKIGANDTPQEKVAQMRKRGLSEDAIVGRLLGEGLDEGQIQFALDDTFGRGGDRIAADIQSGRDQTKLNIGAQGNAQGISSQSANNKRSKLEQSLGDKNNIISFLQGTKKLDEQLFKNANALALNTDILTSLNTTFESTAITLTEAVASTNDIIDALNAVTIALGFGSQINRI